MPITSRRLHSTVPESFAEERESRAQWMQNLLGSVASKQLLNDGRSALSCRIVQAVHTFERQNVREMLPLWDALLTLTVDNTLLQRLLVKRWTRMSGIMLPLRTAPWCYQRGQRVLLNTYKADG